MAAGHRVLPLLAAVVVADSAEDILTPVADSPLGSFEFEGDSPASDEATPVGAPTMTKPKPGAAVEATPASGASSGGVVAHIGARLLRRQAFTGFHDELTCNGLLGTSETSACVCVCIPPSSEAY